ncbi:MAG: hypothetical protein R3E82_05535 [Pseudomonadales bacterium]
MDFPKAELVRPKAATILVNAMVLMGVLLLMEGMIAALLHWPPPMKPLLRVLSSYYTEHDRRIVQALPDCAQYDGVVAYVLRPGSCQFSNYDFETAVDVNSLGLRDDEASIDRPGVVMLGDSFTMGWGVNQSDSFPSIYERVCQTKTLNAGISSYGTVRSLHLLRRINIEALTTLFIQYSDNDYDENRLYFERGNKLQVMSESDFHDMQSQHVSSLTYYPGKHVAQFIPFLARKSSKRVSRYFMSSGTDTHEVTLLSQESKAAFYFLNAMANVFDFPKRTRIVVFRINGRGEFNGSVQHP